MNFPVACSYVIREKGLKARNKKYYIFVLSDRKHGQKTRPNTNGLGQTKQGPSVFCQDGPGQTELAHTSVS